jgi:hypothetical protein
MSDVCCLLVAALSAFGGLLFSGVPWCFLCIYLFYFLSIYGTHAPYSNRFICYIFFLVRSSVIYIYIFAIKKTKITIIKKKILW